MATPLFVYGTLLRGQPADGYLADRDVRSATVRGRLYRVPAGYPALVLDPQGPPISGELILDTDPGMLRVLDLFEGVHNGLYTRVEVRATLAGSGVGQQALFADTLAAWAYVVTAQQARMRRYHALRTTDWRTVAPRSR